MRLKFQANIIKIASFIVSLRSSWHKEGIIRMETEQEVRFSLAQFMFHRSLAVCRKSQITQSEDFFFFGTQVNPYTVTDLTMRT